jgi:hypothetical protein
MLWQTAFFSIKHSFCMYWKNMTKGSFKWNELVKHCWKLKSSDPRSDCELFMSVVFAQCHPLCYEAFLKNSVVGTWAQVVECLPTMGEALGLIPSTTENKTKAPSWKQKHSALLCTMECSPKLLTLLLFFDLAYTASWTVLWLPPGPQWPGI